MSKVLLEAHNIAHAFDYTLFSGVDFVLEGGESVAVVGRSGSGKSTLLHILSTFIKPNHGRVTLFGKEIYSIDEQTIEAMRRYEIGMIFQFHYLFKGMTAMQNVEVATMLSGEPIDQKIFAQLEIDDVMGQKIGELSGGQQQRVSIARVLSKKPRIIFADEPTGNLDSETSRLVMDVLLAYIEREEAALLLVTHDMQLASRCDRRYRLVSQNLESLHEG